MRNVNAVAITRGIAIVVCVSVMIVIITRVLPGVIVGGPSLAAMAVKS
jgi:hypothetical protein